MNQSPAQQWSALSSLYEQADALAPDALPAWLAQLEREANPLLPQLRRMLDARAHLETNDFLGSLPKLPAADPKLSVDWAAGKAIGPYRLVRPLGEGGMAEVWLAERDDGALKRRVAIKLPYPRPGRETFAIRFDRERDILATLRHPNIAGLYDAGVTSDGQAWLALEYVDGQPLSSWCDAQRIGVRERVTLFRQVLLAVQHAHANLVIHRDLKPANILVTAQGEVRLLDFGIAKLLEAEGDAMPETELTRQAGRALTPRYASPEQFIGLPLTTACDVYSLGVVFYELISGERPYELKVESAAQLEHAILEVEPRAPSRRNLSEAHALSRGTYVKALRKTLAPELDAIALRCLAKQPSARYSSVDALLADIDRWLAGEAVLARAPGPWYRFGKFAARNRLGVALSGAALMSLVTVAAVAVVLGVQAREESARAVAARDFMLNLFKRADQEKSRGADITARDLLETGRKDVMTRLVGQPSLQAELLEGIAKIQNETGMGESTAADSTYSELVRIYGAMQRPREAALAQTSRAFNALYMGNPQLASTLLQQAKNIPHRPLNDAELTARLTEVEGWIASTLGQPQHARDLFQESRRVAMAAFGPDDEKTLGAVKGLVGAEQQMGNFGCALALQSELEAAVARSKKNDPKEVVGLDFDRAEILYFAGLYADVLAHTRLAIPRCVAALGPKDDSCGKLQLRKVQALLRLGHTALDSTDVSRIEELMNDQNSPAVATEALLLLFRWEARRANSSRREALFERVRVFGQSGAEVPINPQLKAKALLALGEARLWGGDSDAARLWIVRALSLVRQDDQSVSAGVLRGVGTSLMGVALLEERRYEAALDAMQRARADLVAALGPRHPLEEVFSLNISMVLRALGRVPEALSTISDAEPVLRRSLGESSPTYIRVQHLKTRIRESAATGGSTALDFFS